MSINYLPRGQTKPHNIPVEQLLIDPATETIYFVSPLQLALWGDEQ
jgi:hypothetical protein